MTRKTVPDNDPNIPENDRLYFYRYDPKTDGIETLPSWLSKSKVGSYVDGLQFAKEKLGFDYKLAPEDIQARLMLEHRNDFGTNRWDTNNKAAKLLHAQLLQYDAPPHVADFVAALKSSQDISRRANIPEAKAWNGRGKNRFGQTGDQYADLHNDTVDVALQHPQNADYVDWMNNRMGVFNPSDPQPPSPQVASTSSDKSDQNILGNDPYAMPFNYKTGGRVRVI
jgi:hypothetical protein